MSLVGSLEDLGLGDILQIVSLARKSGRLVLRTDGDAGWIVLCDGLVRGAAIKGRGDDLRSLLVASGDLSGEDFDQARERATGGDLPIDEALAEQQVSPERLESLRREHVERSVMDMFLWRSGEFSFEVRDEVDAEDQEMLLSSGVNTQYLAMEATRLRDEGELLGPVPGEADEDEPMFSGEEPALEPLQPEEAAPAPDVDAAPDADAAEDETELPGAEVVDAMALASVRTVEGEEGPEASTQPDVDVEKDEVTLSGYDAPAVEPVAAVASEVPVEETLAPAPETVAVAVEDAAPSREAPPLVALDADLVALEWFKAQTQECFPRVHIFQRAELGMDRVRSYLARGVAPLVVASPSMLDQQHDGRDLLLRLRSLSPRMSIHALCASESDPVPEGTDGCVRRPAVLLPDPESWESERDCAEQLVADLQGAARDHGARPATRPHAALSSLRSVSDRLRDPERRDDVLTVVLEFAARSFSRVAVFMLRDDQVMGIAESGMSRNGGPSGEAIREIVLSEAAMPELFSRALDTRGGVRSALSSEGDAELTQRLGAAARTEAYAAPIESGGSPVALVYGDNLPLSAPIGDTTALEIVLHEAGLALDRASLELALAAAQGD